MEQGFAEQVWQQAAPTFNSKILGPYFEDLARDFTRRYAHASLPGGLTGPVGTTLALYSLHGFYPDLVELAGRRDDLLLVDLPALYGS